VKANDKGVGVPVLRMNNITYGGAFDLSNLKHVELPSREVERYSVQRGDILFNRTNSQELVGKMGVWNRDDSYAFAGYLVRLRLRRDLAEPAFVAAWFNTAAMKALLRTRAKPSINMSNINATEVLKLPVVRPPLAEQRRIAEVLDRMETLRAKRRGALAKLDTLIQGLFIDLFGDPATNPKGWPLRRLDALLAMPLRNGLSPSHSGKVVAKVLTLSAITGHGFDGRAWKTSTFQTRPPSEQAVDENDFLICRGNGSVRLVGKGYFPLRPMLDVTFPDTMIAARVSRERIGRPFLEHAWNSSAVRLQIESLARTTNGTFKVNQTMLEGITLLAPPLDLQREFGRRVAAVETLRTAHRASLAELDALFASLQHHAFRGEL
jgi:type I restriction enzyme S subunit